MHVDSQVLPTYRARSKKLMVSLRLSFEPKYAEGLAMVRRVALVTGASSGFGLLTAAHLAARGYRVFGASRRPPPGAEPNAEWLELDVRFEESVRTCVDRLSAQTDRVDL